MRARLRHPITSIREPFGTAGLIVACVALVAALGGTALAAAKLNSTQKKEAEKIAKKYAGKPGAPGAPGPEGKQGAAGKDGTNGTNGTDGKSVEVAAESKGANCKEGGTSVQTEGEPASKKYICNGSPWTAGGTLPKSATEKGTWAFAVTGNSIWVPLSFPVPLAAPLEANCVVHEAGGPFVPGPCNAHYIRSNGKELVYSTELFEYEEIDPTACLGDAGAPTAPSGNLCVYEGTQGLSPEINLETFSPFADPSSGELFTVGTTGTILRFTSNSESHTGYGTWAVTG